MALSAKEPPCSAPDLVWVRGWARRALDKLREGCAAGRPAAAAGEQPSQPQRRGVALTSADLEVAVAERAARSSEQAFDPRAFTPERVNAQIAKRYKMDRFELGQGANGKVFVAEDREIKGRLVAIKKISTLTPSRRQQFETEASVMKMLDHPNICKLLETYDEGESVFLVIEYCEGGELFYRIFSRKAEKDRSGLSEDECANIIRQMASALRHAHARGIAHRDLKPENVCLVDVAPGPVASSSSGSCVRARQKEESVKVIDWGLSCYFDQEDLMHSRVGTVAYAAPEVLEDCGRSSGYTSACDIWSLGVLAYVSLSGSYPFAGRNAAQQRLCFKAGPCSFNSSAWFKISGTAKSFVSSCLQLDPSARPTAGAVLDHPWLRQAGAAGSADAVATRRVLRSLQQSSVVAYQVSMYAALVARQLDHWSLRELPQVFQSFDLDGSGELELSEFKSAFEKVLGSDSEDFLNIERMFRLLDLDGSGSINYTEFLAAALGERVQKEESLKAAFKAFDVHDDDNRITKHEFEQAVANLSLRENDSACESVFSEFDFDGDGTLDFEEWKAWVNTRIMSAGKGGA